MSTFNFLFLKWPMTRADHNKLELYQTLPFSIVAHLLLKLLLFSARVLSHNELSFKLVHEKFVSQAGQSNKIMDLTKG